jgi:hypothetical protein
MVQPQTLPVRAVGSVTLVGNMGLTDESATAFRLELDKALYFGGLDEVGGCEEGTRQIIVTLRTCD